MDSREFHSSEAREKLDCINPIEHVLRRENSGNQQNGPRCDLRKSLAWDSAFFTSPGVLDVEELFSSLNLRENDITLDVKGKCSNGAFSSMSFEPERRSERAESDGRTSLAWNSAFFTDPGVLNAEELFLVNGGFSKTRAHRVPETNKELWKSFDSSSTAKGSRYSVTSIESDLFEDLRTASRRSTKKQDDTRSVSAKHKGMREIHLSKDSDAASAPKKLKTLPHPGRQRTVVHRQKKIQQEPSRLIAHAKGAVCSGESIPLSCQKPDKFMCECDVTRMAISMDKALSPLEQAKPVKTGMNMSSLKKRCAQEQAGSTPIVRSTNTSGWRRVADSRLTASDSSFKTPSRFAFDRALGSRFPEKNRNTPTKHSPLSDTPTKHTPLSDIAAKNIRASGLRVPLPKIGFFDSENAQKENNDPNLVPKAEAASRRLRGRKSSQIASLEGRPSPLGCRKSATHSANKGKCSKIEGKSEMGTRITDGKTQRNGDVVIEF